MPCVFVNLRCFCYFVRSPRLQQYARDARKEYTELSSKDLSELKTFVKGLPKLLLLDRLSDLAVPVAEVVKQQVTPMAAWLNHVLASVCSVLAVVHHRYF